MPEPKLSWIPLPVDGSIGPPRGLTDFQMGWFWNLFWACAGNLEFPGYLPATATRTTLWTFAGAHRRAHWDANCALVMAAFELREIAGLKMLCLPALVSIVEEQTKKLRNHKKGGGFKAIHSNPQRGGESSPSQSGFDFDLTEPIQTQRSTFARVQAHTANPYSQRDFDARDSRRMAEAYVQLGKRNAEGACLGAGMSTKQMFEYACDTAGVSITRGLELEERRKKWPEQTPDWAKAEAG
jgi:hypothetical protein